MDLYFQKLAKLENEQKVGYSMVLFPVFNALGLYGPVERGNCAYWTAKGLVEAGLLNQPIIWPKLLFVALYVQAIVRAGFESPKPHVHSVFYHHIEYATKPPVIGWVSPWHLWSRATVVFRNLARFADVVVDSKTHGKDKRRLIVREGDPTKPIPPNAPFFRQISRTMR